MVLVGLSTGTARATPATGGNATINLNRALVKRLANHGVKVDGVRPAINRRNTLRLRIGRGDFIVDTNDPAPLEPLAIEWINGSAVLRGGLRLKRALRRGARAVKVTNLRVNLEKRRVTARIGRRNVSLFTVNMGWATPTGASVQRPRLLSAPLRLTPAGARLLNRGIGRALLRKKMEFGQLNLAPVLEPS